MRPKPIEAFSSCVRPRGYSSRAPALRSRRTQLTKRPVQLRGHPSRCKGPRPTLASDRPKVLSRLRAQPCGAPRWGAAFRSDSQGSECRRRIRKATCIGPFNMTTAYWRAPSASVRCRTSTVPPRHRPNLGQPPSHCALRPRYPLALNHISGGQDSVIATGAAVKGFVASTTSS